MNDSRSVRPGFNILLLDGFTLRNTVTRPSSGSDISSIYRVNIKGHKDCLNIEKSNSEVTKIFVVEGQ